MISQRGGRCDARRYLDSVTLHEARRRDMSKSTCGQSQMCARGRTLACPHPLPFPISLTPSPSPSLYTLPPLHLLCPPLIRSPFPFLSILSSLSLCPLTFSSLSSHGHPRLPITSASFFPLSTFPSLFPYLFIYLSQLRRGALRDGPGVEKTDRMCQVGGFIDHRLFHPCVCSSVNITFTSTFIYFSL